jgi:hypothetical protein
MTQRSDGSFLHKAKDEGRQKEKQMEKTAVNQIEKMARVYHLEDFKWIFPKSIITRH